MDITGVSSPQVTAGIAIVKTANEQPELAAELIRQVHGKTPVQNAAEPNQPVDTSEVTGTGTIINTTA